ncbi:F-box/LRR-repeat protein At3g26922-like [Spinacia oleracea]|uniref:F-box/LRR-repeat protein At3g26922-like n=1 Tax=Spinacia oleracea TaxID=3562 RepID=A0A9R0IMQ5_SPIOL|nr:F-box/LRR-repeat protein At3g26922-like [Spinacia oleracea]
MGPKRSKVMSTLDSKDHQIDRLSSLPDNLLIDILSRLPLKSAAITSVLSRQWRYIWTQITNIVLDMASRTSWNWNGCVFTTANGILWQLTSPKIHRFELCLPFSTKGMKKVRFSYVESWIHDICVRNTDYIQVQGSCMWDNYPIPTCILQCQSLVVLQLIGGISIKVPHGGLVVSLPKLKKFNFSVEVLDCELLAKLFRSCPLLEDLTLAGEFLESEQCFDLSVHNLKILVIKASVYPQPKHEKFVINASKLQEITLCGTNLDFVRFVNYSNALITANIRLKSILMDKVDYLSRTTDLARLISSVSSLNLNSTILKAFTELETDLLPVFDNLSSLSITLGDGYGSWNDMLQFLRRSPKLEFLRISLPQVFRWDISEQWSGCWSRLKRIGIKYINGTDADVEMIKYLLNHAKELEVLSVYVRVPGNNKAKMSFLREKLFGLQKYSTCKIKFYGRYGLHSPPMTNEVGL